MIVRDVIRRHARVLQVFLVGLLVLSVAACGGSAAPTSTPANSGEGSATSSAASATSTSDQAGGAATPSSSTVTLTLYSGQHEALSQALADGFQEASGIKVEVRAGTDAALANQIIEEGDRTKADIFMTEEPGQAALLGEKGIFAPVDPATLAMTDARFNPHDGTWLAFAARSRAIFYNPSVIAEDELPASIMDLAKPEWKGKFAYAPSGAFVSTVTYLINTIGEEKTLEWLRGIKENGENLQKNGAIRDAVEAGQIGFGLNNHYYWYVLAEQKGGPDALASKIHYMSDGDAGALVLASGAGILKVSKHEAEAQQFLAWLADPNGGQKIIATTTPQYPLAPGVESSMGLKPLSELEPPDVDQGSFGNVEKARELITEAGII